MTRVRNSKLRTERQNVISEQEFNATLARAGEIKQEFLRLRALAVLCLLRLTGKRRGEISILPLDSFKTEEGFLNVTFILEKKRRGNVLQRIAVKSVPLADPLCHHIMSYLDYLEGLNPKPRWFLPRASSVFGHTLIVDGESHISGRQLFNLVRNCSQTVWPHLFRETVASDIIREDSSIFSAFKVQRRLDLESYQTGFNYLRRFATDVINRQDQTASAQT